MPLPTFSISTVTLTNYKKERVLPCYKKERVLPCSFLVSNAIFPKVSA